MAAEWIVPFKGRNDTGIYNQNFLWRSGNVFVMDNHRAAAWCWAQCIEPHVDHALVHIDRHRDTLCSQLGTWLSLLPNGIPTSIDDYLTLSQSFAHANPAPVFRWDNYLSIYFGLFGHKVTQSYFATHGEGDKPNHMPSVELSPTELLAYLPGPIASAGVPTIMNIDLDYLFGPDPDDDSEISPAVRILDDNYFTQLIKEIAALDRAAQLPVITIALTATNSLTSGWEPAEELAAQLCNALGHRFALPA